MQQSITPIEENADRNGKIGATVAFVLLLVLLLIPLFFTQLPKPGQPGILVNLGQINVGQGNQNAGPSAPAISAPDPEPEPEEDTAPPPPPPPAAAEPIKTPPKEVIVTETPQEIAIRKRKAREEAKRKADAERKRRTKAEADKRKRTEAEAERRRKQKEAAERKKAAEAAAAKKAAEEAARKKREAEAQATRDRVAGMFGNGSGKGNTGKPGNQGVDNGDPDADKLSGISTGDGRVSGGLGGRGVLKSPVVRENSQVPGRVKVKVCVSPQGKITSADITQSGTTTTDPKLRSAAVRNARKWLFESNPTAPAQQCGYITYDFKVQ